MVYAYKKKRQQIVFFFFSPVQSFHASRLEISSHLLCSQLFNLLIYALWMHCQRSILSPRKLKAQFCGKEPIISPPLTFKCILSSCHKDKHGLKNYRWWMGGEQLPVSQEHAKLLLFCTYTAAVFSSAVCLFQHQLSPPVVWIQNFLEDGLLFQSLHKGLRGDLLPETWKSSAKRRGYMKTK